jgi:hypothetical protein
MGIMGIQGLVLLFVSCRATQIDEVLFLVRSQPSPHDAAAADELKQTLLTAGVAPKNVICLHELDSRGRHGKWTIRPWIANAWGESMDASIKWIAMVEPTTRINTDRLPSTLSTFDHTQSHLLGHALSDHEHNIHAVIHHYQSKPGFHHPFLPSGMFFSRGLVEQIGELIKKEGLPQDTHIDVSHELVQWLDKHLELQMTNGTDLCASADLSSDHAKCATYVVPLGSASAVHLLPPRPLRLLCHHHPLTVLAKPSYVASIASFVPIVHYHPNHPVTTTPPPPLHHHHLTPRSPPSHPTLATPSPPPSRQIGTGRTTSLTGRTL